MHLRRTTALAAVLLALGSPALGACGQEAATNKVNVISEGVNDRAGNIDVLGAVIIGTSDGHGYLYGSFANNTAGTDAATVAAATDTLKSVAGAAGSTVSVEGTLPVITIAPSSSVSLRAEGLEIPVTGDFAAGDFVELTLTFASGQVSTLDVNVVKPCNQYADVVPTPTATPTVPETGGFLGSAPSTTTTPSTAPAAPDTSSTPDPEASSQSAEDGGNDAPYSCDAITRPTETPNQT